MPGAMMSMAGPYPHWRSPSREALIVAFDPRGRMPTGGTSRRRPRPSGPSLMRTAVVGHVEWVDFACVDRMPRAGEIVHVHEAWEEAAGGGAVAAVQLAALGAEVAMFTALGDDERGRA